MAHMTTYTFRPYNHEDYDDCVQIFQQNTPQYFHPGELADYKDYLKNYALGNYWIYMAGSTTIGCAGIRVSENIGRLVYGMITPAYHRHGHGKDLLNFRLRKLVELAHVTHIKLETSPEAMGFFSKLGFVEERRIENGFGPGLDQIYMSLHINPALRQKILAHQTPTDTPNPKIDLSM